MPTATTPRHKLTGVCPPARGAVIEELTRAHAAPVWLIVTEELKAAEQLAEEAEKRAGIAAYDAAMKIVHGPYFSNDVPKPTVDQIAAIIKEECDLVYFYKLLIKHR